MVKIAILICGQFRALHKVYKQFDTIFDADYFLSIDHEIDDYNILKECPKVRQIVFQQKIRSNEFRNVRNYSSKISNGCKILPSGYDYYIIIRSDLIIEDPDFLNQVNDVNNIYVFDYNHNPFIINKTEKMNGNCIIIRDYKYVALLSGIDDYVEKNSVDYFDVVLYYFLKDIPVKMIRVTSQILLFSCRVIAISGDSGSGKTRLCESLNRLFENENILKLETDRYHKWERGDPHYETYTHLHPEANYLQKMEDDVYNLILGDGVFAVDYDHSTGRFTPLEKISSKENIILCGLHTLWSSNLRPLLNLKIFMDTDRELIQEWKIHRDVTQRGKLPENVKKEMERRHHDYMSYINTQKEDADIIIQYYKCGSSIRCKCIFKIFHYRLLRLMELCDYQCNGLDNGQVIVELKGDTTPLKIHMLKMGVIDEIIYNRIENEYNGEIQLIINYLENGQ
jgi:uridine kinase